ncbi:MAG: 2,3-bisphosphoglycerate-independent phosphoglycerate mutase [bacterium]
MLKRDRVILVIMDGLGLSSIDNDESNAFKLANTPHLDQIFEMYDLCRLQASGRAVGLPQGQMGNSEVGHQNLGAGRVVYQDITRIDLSIENGAFQANEAMRASFDYAISQDRPLHLMGLVSDGGVHSSLHHLEAIVKAAHDKGVRQVFIHALMDGRDTPPHGGLGYIQQVENFCRKIGSGKIATVIGRYYGMDRDNRWERIEKAYRALVRGVGLRFDNAEAAVQASYDRKITDEFIDPSVIMENDQPIAKIQSGDAVLFFNFRADRVREITNALIQSDFNEFKVEKLDLHYTTLTRYHQDYDFPVMFPKQSLHNILGEILAQSERRQLRLAETEKYAHVTFFFNGGEERVFPGEDRELVSSPKVATYDLQPEMSAPEVTSKAVEALKSEKYDFIVLNFANPDMVGHTGIIEAAVKAVEAVDAGVWQVMRAAYAHDYAMILTSDHGNCEMMIDPHDGGPHTAHTTNLVPCFVMDKVHKVRLRKEGALCDVAPTILDILRIEKPTEMEGQSLITCVDCLL